jgi:hypothetical protein
VKDRPLLKAFVQRQRHVSESLPRWMIERAVQTTSRAHSDKPVAKSGVKEDR